MPRRTSSARIHFCSVPGGGGKDKSKMAMEHAGERAPFVIRWREGFKINISEIDDEHQHLFTLVKALDLRVVEQTVEELLDYVVTHFSNEQALMERSGYPAFDQHLKLHEDFSAQVTEFLWSGEPWTEERVQKLRRFLNKWLIGHIMTHDLRFGRWYAERRAAMRLADSQSRYIGSFSPAR